jgi:cell division protein FtsZ
MLPENLNFFLEENPRENAVIKVVGVGGGGCNAVKNMIELGIKGVDIIAVNTDIVALNSNPASIKIQIGKQLTKGLGAGANPEIGRKSAEENKDEIAEALKDADMVFVTAGMGGGTGTGAAPVVASIAKSLGALVVGIVTKPFVWEGPARMRNAEAGISELRQHVDSLIVIPNQRISAVADKKIKLKDAFNKPNEILYLATVGITSIITEEGVVNVDFADVKRVMYQSGNALIGVGTASGENRATLAAQQAISSPLLEGVSIKGARNVLLNVTCGEDFSFDELEEGNEVVRQAAGEGVDIIFGYVINENMGDKVSYTLIATGFDKKEGSLSTPKTTVYTHKPKLEKEQEDLFVNKEQNNFNSNKVAEPVFSVNSPKITPIPKMNDDLLNNNDNMEDISIPTYQRIKQQKPVANTNFSISNKTVDLNTTSDLDDSSFLRAILD